MNEQLGEGESVEDLPLVAATVRLRERTAPWSCTSGVAPFAPAITHVYAPLTYAWRAHEVYLRRYGVGQKRVLFVGMNPGPFGMVQTGIPFGDVPSVRDWLQIVAEVDRPPAEDPRKPVLGFACPRREVSGARLWGLFAERFGTADAFFADHFVVNYCPLAFLADGRNVTPDKLPQAVRAPLLAACDHYLRAVVALLAPQWVVGVGQWAAERARVALAEMGDAPRVTTILHPSPASPAANRGWAAQAVAQLQEAGVWR
ncbi:single-stranded DNA-binding protein [Hydrogenophilus islandicus]